MDTISRENNSMLPVGAIIVGAIGLLLGGLALVQVSKVNKAVADQQLKVDRIDSVESQAASASTAAEKARSDVSALQRSTQEAMNQVGAMIGDMGGKITKLEESAKRPAAVTSTKKGGEPVVAGPGEYIVKSGDTGIKIAGANGIRWGDLQAVNPGVNWNSLRVGQKLKLPAR